MTVTAEAAWVVELKGADTVTSAIIMKMVFILPIIIRFLLLFRRILGYEANCSLGNEHCVIDSDLPITTNLCLLSKCFG